MYCIQITTFDGRSVSTLTYLNMFPTEELAEKEITEKLSAVQVKENENCVYWKKTFNTDRFTIYRILSVYPVGEEPRIVIV